MSRGGRRSGATGGFSAGSLLDAPVASMLDLHGAGAIDAAEMVRRFIVAQRRARPGSIVHIVTGKGRGSAGRPVLKPLVARLLRDDLAEHVAEHSRDLDDGGYLVRLR